MIYYSQQVLPLKQYYSLISSERSALIVNVQFKKGVLNLCVLVLLDKQDRYGYELVQKISNQISISEGSVYPLLRRLTKEGYFTTYLQESSEGPPRKYYKLTDTGRTYLHEQLEEWRNFTEGVNTLIEESVRNDD
jgi:PadR family transcriptional regulator, regulatory protein PadR